MPAAKPCLCGADDCERCNKSNFTNGQYLNPDHYCDVCQRFTGAVCDSCEWCGMDVCAACEGEHREGHGKGDM
jgi:hypothetical protein